MPTYEYICKSCGHLFEIVQSMRDDSLTECPECGGELRKVFAPPAIAFKGSGFYATDQRKKVETPGDKSDKAEKAGKTDKDGRGDKKPDVGSGTGGDEKGPKREAPAASAKKEASSSSSASSDSSGASSGSRSNEGSGS